MPRKNLVREAVPTLIQERLMGWGLVIRTQRAFQRIRAADLCSRLDISEATLRRLERGDPGAGVGIYLMAFQVLGVFNELTPVPPKSLWDKEVKQRVRLPLKENNENDEDYF